MDIETQIKKDIGKHKRNLIKKAKQNGLYENFGQKEISKLKDKYFDHQYKPEYKHIDGFNEWCMTFDQTQLKNIIKQQ